MHVIGIVRSDNNSHFQRMGRTLDALCVRVRLVPTAQAARAWLRTCASSGECDTSNLTSPSSSRYRLDNPTKPTAKAWLPQQSPFDVAAFKFGFKTQILWLGCIPPFPPPQYTPNHHRRDGQTKRIQRGLLYQAKGFDGRVPFGFHCQCR